MRTFIIAAAFVVGAAMTAEQVSAAEMFTHHKSGPSVGSVQLASHYGHSRGSHYSSHRSYRHGHGHPPVYRHGNYHSFRYYPPVVVRPHMHHPPVYHPPVYHPPVYRSYGHGCHHSHGGLRIHTGRVGFSIAF